MPRNAERPIFTSTTHLLHRAGQHAESCLDEEMRRLGLDVTARQLAVMEAAKIAEGASQTTLVNMTGVDRSTLSEIMRRLIQKGLAERRRVGMDRRAYAVTLTKAGDDLLARALPGIKQIDAMVLGQLPGKRRKPFVDSLSSVVTGLAARVPAEQE